MPDLETPDADAAEQQQPVTDDEPETGVEDRDAEADDGDLAEQSRAVPVDEDDYR